MSESMPVEEFEITLHGEQNKIIIIIKHHYISAFCITMQMDIFLMKARIALFKMKIWSLTSVNSCVIAVFIPIYEQYYLD